MDLEDRVGQFRDNFSPRKSGKCINGLLDKTRLLKGCYCVC